jgi:hypothetical protein
MQVDLMLGATIEDVKSGGGTRSTGREFDQQITGTASSLAGMRIDAVHADGYHRSAVSAPPVGGATCRGPARRR